MAPKKVAKESKASAASSSSKGAKSKKSSPVKNDDASDVHLMSPAAQDRLNKQILGALNYHGKHDLPEVIEAKKEALQIYKRANPEHRINAMQRYLDSKEGGGKWQWLASWTQTATESRTVIHGRVEDWMSKYRS